ncbi:unnamed protein product [Sphacelaria rigidula]
MVNVRKKRCGYEGCPTQASYGIAGSTKTEFCFKHARTGMVNVQRKKCDYEGCPSQASYGVAGSTKAAFCFKHARAGMVNVRNKTCGYRGCPSQSSYGAAGSTKAELCSKHARAGMVNVRNKRCGYEGCPSQASYGVAGSTKTEFCFKHARTGMVNVKKMCGYEGCPMQPSDGVAGSKEAEFCSKHVKARMVNVARTMCGNKECSKRPLDKGTRCQQHASAHDTAVVSDTTKLNTGKGIPDRSATEGGRGSVANVRGVKRKRATLSGSGANDGKDARRSFCAGSIQEERTPSLSGRPLLLPRHPHSRADDEAPLRAGARAGMKVELTVSSPIHGGDGTRMFQKQASPSSGWGSKDDSGFTSAACGGTGWGCGSPATVTRCLCTFDGMALEEVEEDSNVKLELGVPGASPPTSDIRKMTPVVVPSSLLRWPG